MGIGGSVFLLAVGAILTFAVKDSTVAGIDLSVVGIILMLCGVLGIVLEVALFAPRRRRRSVTAVDDGTQQRTVRREDTF
jgi:Na+/phosphate symporter